MSHRQRYVSRELTHFAGRGLNNPDDTPDNESRYACLIKIAKDGRLLHRRDDPDGPARIAFYGGGSFTDRTMFELDAVYFCDIPVADFPLHMRKYSHFGLSFPKAFLVKQGANPAFYVTSDAVVADDDPAALVLFADADRPRPLKRGDLLDRLIKRDAASGLRMLRSVFSDRLEHGVTRPGSELAQVSILDAFMRSYFISFCIPFDSSREEHDRDNYYMEREWRVIGDVKFTLDDISRVLLPSAYAKRLRSDLPDYCGQVTFTDE